MKEPDFRNLLPVLVFGLALWCAQNVCAASGDSMPLKPAAAPALPEETAPAPIKPVQPAPESIQEEIPDWKARWELARLLSYAKRYDESLAEYKAVVEQKPDLWEASVEMAQVMFWSGRQAEASEILEKIPPEHVDESAKLLMADLYVAQKSFGKAEPIYRAYLEAHPQDLEVGIKLADLLSWSKRYEEAIAQYQKILEARPDDVQLRRKYAYVLIWAGRQSEAAVELRKTLKQEP